MNTNECGMVSHSASRPVLRREVQLSAELESQKNLQVCTSAWFAAMLSIVCIGLKSGHFSVATISPSSLPQRKLVSTDEWQCGYSVSCSMAARSRSVMSGGF